MNRKRSQNRKLIIGLIILIGIIFSGWAIPNYTENNGNDQDKNDNNEPTHKMIFPKVPRNQPSYNATLGPIIDKDGNSLTNRDIIFIFNETIEYHTQTNEYGIFWFNVSKTIIENFDGQEIFITISGLEEKFYFVIEIGNTGIMTIVSSSNDWPFKV